MTDQQEQHLQEIKQATTSALDAKYRRGQQEHGGDLWNRPVLNDLTDEVIDLITYVHTAKEQRNTIYQLVGDARFHIQRGDWAAALSVLDKIHHLCRPN